MTASVQLRQIPMRRQRGLALVIMITMLALGGTYIMIEQMNGLSQRLATDQTTADVLSEAKFALMGWSASNAITADRPGVLPCPDRKAIPDGYSSAGYCDSPNDRVGRLPWKTLGIRELRDSSGELLWYALSGNFRDSSGVVVNSNTTGTLAVTGLNPTTNAVALIISPGRVVSGQTRDTASANLVQMYLEGANNYQNDSGAINDDSFQFSALSDTFNDRILSVSAKELFDVVEPVIATRIQNEIVPEIQKYYAKWNAYPNPAAFTDPSATPVNSTYLGSSATSYGLLPVMANVSAAAVQTTTAQPVTLRPTITYTPNPPSGNGAVTANQTHCTATTASRIVCQIRYRRFAPTITITARIANVGQSFFETQFTTADASIVSNAPAAFTCPATSPNPSISHVLGADGMDTITYRISLRTTGTGATYRTCTISFPDYSSAVNYPFNNALTSATLNPSITWFRANNWHELLLYAIAPGYKPGGTGSCTPGANCLTLSSNIEGTVQKGALLVLAGRPITNTQAGLTQTRPSSALTDYFENQNPASTPASFTHARLSPTSNDKVITIAP